MVKVMSNKKMEMELDNSNSKTYLELLDGRTEELHFEQVKPTKFTVNDSNFNLKSGANVDLEIMNVDLEATSKTIWPGQKIRVRGGLNGQGEPMKAFANIPLSKNIADGVDSESFLYWVIDTPDGSFHNKKPIHMKGVIKGLPPKDTQLKSDSVIPLYDSENNQVATIYGCLQSN